MTVNDRLYKKFTSYGGETINERIYHYLGSLGFTGTFNDRLSKLVVDEHRGWQALIYESSSLASLFKEGDSGVWYSPSQLDSMFLDVEGTQEATQEADVIARIEDLSGRGVSAVQEEPTLRPYYSASPASLVFDGVRDYLDCQTGRIGRTGLFCDSGESFTLAGSFNIVPATGGHTLVARGAGAGTERTFHLTVNSESGLTCRIRGASSVIAGGVMDGEWHTYFLRWDGETLEGGVDGGETVVLAVGTEAEQTNQRILIGAQGSPPEDSPGNFINGSIGEVFLIDRALNETELAKLRNL